MSLGTGNTLDRLVHPALLDNLARAFPSLATVQAATETQTVNGEIEQSWANVAGLVNLPCILAEGGTGGVFAREQRRMEKTAVSFGHVCDLRGYYPGILVTHRVVVSSKAPDCLSTRSDTYNITGVIHDSQARQTRLELEVVSQ